MWDVIYHGRQRCSQKKGWGILGKKIEGEENGVRLVVGFLR